jgi:exonuclease III
VIKITSLPVLIILICIYRSPNGDFTLFLKYNDTVLSQYRKPGTKIILCGDINIDYLNEKCHKCQHLDTLLTSYNLISTVRFPTRSIYGTSSATGNIFIDKHI